MFNRQFNHSLTALVLITWESISQSSMIKWAVIVTKDSVAVWYASHNRSICFLKWFHDVCFGLIAKCGNPRVDKFSQDGKFYLDSNVRNLVRKLWFKDWIQMWILGNESWDRVCFVLRPFRVGMLLFAEWSSVWQQPQSHVFHFSSTSLVKTWKLTECDFVPSQPYNYLKCPTEICKTQ